MASFDNLRDMPSSILKFNKVTKKFGDVLALKDVSFEIESGEFVFVTGPSGSGKTTLIRLILGDLIPDEGEICFLDQNITEISSKDIPKLRQKIGVVFQDFKVLSERTIRENVEIALAVVGVDREKWEEKVNKTLELVGILDKASFFPSQLSGGELQRVSLARALVVDPNIILADEPTGNLDWETADSLMVLFENINKKGKTVIISTHHKLIIDKLKKRVIKLKKPKKGSSQKDAKLEKVINKNKKQTKQT